MKKFLAIVALLVCFMATNVIPADATVPNIPRKTKTVKKSSSSNHSTAWGTEYDWLSTCYATYDDIRNMYPGQIRVLKNSIYARHGRIFKDKSLRSYFNSCWWYHGWRNEVPVRELNTYEKENIEFLRHYE